MVNQQAAPLVNEGSITGEHIDAVTKGLRRAVQAANEAVNEQASVELLDYEDSDNDADPEDPRILALLDPSVEELRAENRVMTESEIMEAETVRASDVSDDDFTESMQHFQNITQ